MSGGIHKVEEHDIGYVDVFCVDANRFGHLPHGCLQSVGGRTIPDQISGQFAEKVLLLQNVGQFKRDANAVLE